MKQERLRRPDFDVAFARLTSLLQLQLDGQSTVSLDSGETWKCSYSVTWGSVTDAHGTRFINSTRAANTVPEVAG